MTSPVTPQRAHRPSHSHSQSLSYSHVRSPASPATPYTPMSLRSFTSSNPPSTLTTPASAKSHPNVLRSMAFSSPQLVKSYTATDNGLADLAQNWRSRANENGIKVSKGMVNASYEEDDSSFYDGNDSSSFITTEEALLPPPFLSNHRRRSLSQSHASAMNANQRMIPTSPLARKTVTTIKNSVIATPPPNRDLARQLKLKGSLTDPAQTRRREAFGVVSNTPQRNLDISLDLFDIDENDVEHEYDYDNHFASENTRKHEHSLLPAQDTMQSQYHQEYPPYHLFNNVLPSAPMIPIFGQPTFADPFMANSSLPSRIDGSFNRYPHHSHQYSFTHSYLEPQTVEHSQPIIQPLSISTSSEPEPSPVSCSVCSRHNPPRLAVLVPCKHPLCSSCLTSALNIVGEKDMECAVCKQSVEDFKLISGTPPKFKKSSLASHVDSDDERTSKGKSFLDPLFSSPGSVMSGLESAFEFERGESIFGHELRASTPPPQSRRRPIDRKAKSAVVLRIDNVPWDITPPTITTWLQQPIERAHVLLDRKGKTMSHAFVEVKSEDIAAAILRGETTSGTTKGRQDMPSTQKGRGSVLGKGRRARGVTVTRSSQEELMASLFPGWRGAFDGPEPSLVGMDNDRMITALECGLMGDSEVTALLYLIRSPDAHFLKVPSLPFHSLISVLSKFPGDIDSRVFWSATLRDLLYDAAFTATQVLQSRIEKEPLSEEFTEALLEELLGAGSGCRIFTPQQAATFKDILMARDVNVSLSEDGSISSYNPDADIEDGDEDEHDFHTPSSATAASPRSTSADPPTSDVEDLAREFGVEAHLVQALAQRLATASLR